jgi:hypothetical protein
VSEADVIALVQEVRIRQDRKSGAPQDHGRIANEEKSIAPAFTLMR